MLKNITVFQKFGCELLNGCTHLMAVQNDKARRIVDSISNVNVFVTASPCDQNIYSRKNSRVKYQKRAILVATKMVATRNRLIW
jgi:hypothetical protein